MPQPDLPNLAEAEVPGLFAPSMPRHITTQPPTSPASSAPRRFKPQSGENQRASQKPRRDETVLVLVDAGGDGDAPMDVRLARALKCLGRRFRLKVKDIRQTSASPARRDPQAPSPSLSPAPANASQRATTFAQAPTQKNQPRRAAGNCHLPLEGEPPMIAPQPGAPHIYHGPTDRPSPPPPPPAPSSTPGVKKLADQIAAREAAKAKRVEVNTRELMVEYLRILTNPDSDPAGEKLESVIGKLGINVQQAQEDSATIADFLRRRANVPDHAAAMTAARTASTEVDRARDALEKAEAEFRLAAAKEAGGWRAADALLDVAAKHSRFFKPGTTELLCE